MVSRKPDANSSIVRVKFQAPAVARPTRSRSAVAEAAAAGLVRRRPELDGGDDDERQRHGQPERDHGPAAPQLADELDADREGAPRPVARGGRRGHGVTTSFSVLVPDVTTVWPSPTISRKMSSSRRPPCPAQQVGHRAAGDDAPAAHDDDVAARLLDLAEQVRGDDDRAAVARVVLDDLPHLLDLRRVEAVGRLVEQEQVGHAEHRLRDAEPLAHALAVGADPTVDRAAEPGDLEDLVEPGVDAGAAAGPPEEVEVLPAGEVGEQPGSLDEAADAREGGGPGVDLLAEHAGLARGGGDQSHDHPHGRALARPVGPEQAEDDVRGAR